MLEGVGRLIAGIVVVLILVPIILYLYKKLSHSKNG